jgi:DNA-binding transcriptional regulator GbsR (MarR family)
MRQLYPSELQAILKELQKQKLVDEYAEQKNKWAFLAAVITNGFGAITSMFSKRKHKAVSPDDFMGKDAKKAFQQLLGQEQLEQKGWSRHIEDAKAKGLKGGETLC